MLVTNSLLEAGKILKNFIENEENIKNIETMITLIANSLKQGNKIIICGNGGSLTDAMHFAEELTGRFRDDRNPLPAIALSDPSHITCVANDYGFSEIFSRSITALGNENDIFIGISTSGNSENIIKALDSAKIKNMNTILFLGKDGGKLKNKSDLEIIIPAKTSDRIQELHMTILHIIIEMVERKIFPENYGKSKNL